MPDVEIVDNDMAIPVAMSSTVNVVSGSTDHATLSHLDYESSGHTGFAASSDIPTKTSDLTNDSGFLTEHQSLTGYATEVWVQSQNYALDTDVDAIEEKIPSQASSVNQLADKAFVNSSISTNTANYISNSGEPFTSLAQLQAYSGTVTNNDYAFVTGTDESGNTYYDRYKASVSGGVVTWAKEYRLNNSSFTAVQWSAIQSGITSEKVSGYDTHLANTNIHVTAADKATWTAKQDAIPANTYDAYGAASSAVSMHNSNASAHASLFAAKADATDLEALEDKLGEIVDETAAYAKTVPDTLIDFARINKVGGHTVVWNQLVNYEQSWTNGIESNNSTISISGETVNATSSFTTYYFGLTIIKSGVLVAGRKYYLSCNFSNSSISSFSSYQFPRTGVSAYLSATGTTSGIWEQETTYNSFYINAVTNGTSLATDTFTVKNIVLIDLTAMFGAGNEPTSTTDSRIVWAQQYALANPAYNAGSLLSAQVTNVKSANTDGTIANLPISQSVRDLCPNYGASAGSVYNYIDLDAKIYHQLVGSRAYQSGDESDTSVITDGTTTYYVLANDVPVDLSSVLGDNLIQTESDGTLTFESTSLLSVPNKTTHGVKDAIETVNNLVTSLSASSTDTQYPSAKCVYDIVGDIETLLGGLL